MGTKLMQRGIAFVVVLFALLSLTALGCEDESIEVPDFSFSSSGFDASSSTSSSSSSGALDSGGEPDSGEADAGADALPDAPAVTYTVGGQVTGLGTSTGLVLQLNGSNDLAIGGDGGFVFDAQLLNGASYSVTISSQPAGKTCNVSAGSGTIQSQHVSSVVVNCASDTFTIGGSVTGLAAGASVTLSNGGASLTVTANGSFAFPTPVNAGAAYSVVVSTQPSSPVQVCTVTNGSGTVSTSNVTNIAVACVTSTFTVGGTVNGLSGGSVTMQINGGETRTVDQNGPWSFPTALVSGSSYTVTVLSHPTAPAQTCTVVGGNGVVGGANVTTVVVECSNLTYTIGGTLAGLGAGKSITLQNGADTLTLNANGAFTFPTAQNSGTSFDVSITTQPQDQTCTVAAGNGTVGSANVTSVVVNCDSSLHTIGGTVTGLNGTLVLTNGTETQTINTPGTSSFSFPTPVASGTAYDVAVTSQPTFSGGGVNQTCTVANGTGSVAGAPVTNIAVTCVTNAFTLSGRVQGLQPGATITLSNGSDTRAVVGTAGVLDTFTFPTKVPSGVVYNVTTPGTPPSGNTTGSPVEQRCEVTSGGNGVMGDGDVTSVLVECHTIPHTVRVDVTGLATGSSVTVRNVRTATPATPSPGDNTETSPALTSNGTHTFSAQVLSGQEYAVSVVAQPVYASGGANQTCTVGGNATGTIGSADVVVTVTCVTNRFSVGALIQGLADNGGTNTVTLSLTSAPAVPPDPAKHVTRNQNGAFVFADPDLHVPSGASYTLKVEAHPIDPKQTCEFASTGTDTLTATMENGPVTGVLVNCAHDAFSVGGSMSGLAGTVVLRNHVTGPEPPPNPADELLPWSTNGAYTFANTVVTTKTYAVTVDQHPQFGVTAGGVLTGRHQQCTVANAGGTIGTTNVNDVNVSCTTQRHSVTGTVSGLLSAKLPLRLSDGVNQIDIGIDGGFTFPDRPSGEQYTVSVVNHPLAIDQTCTVTSQGSGVVAGVGNYIQNADVTGVTVTCVRNASTINAVVHGLATGSVTLQNGADTIAVTANGSPQVSGSFPTKVPNGSTYSVSVTGQPGTQQYCNVIGGTGTVPMDDTPSSIDVQVQCGITCRGIHLTSPGSPSGVYQVDPDGIGSAPPVDTFCDMETDGGGWALVMKVNGLLTTFAYDNAIWTNTIALGTTTQQATLDLQAETKHAIFSTLSFEQVRAMLVGLEGRLQVPRSVILNHASPSLRTLFTGSFVSATATAGVGGTGTGRDAWLSTVADSRLQQFCNMEGFNINPANLARVRIGIVGNEQNHCASPDSWLGIGGWTDSACAYSVTIEGPPPPPPTFTAGNASPTGNHGDIGSCEGGSVEGRRIPRWGLVWVR